MMPLIEWLEQRRHLSTSLPAGAHLEWRHAPQDDVAGRRMPAVTVELVDSAGRRINSSGETIQLSATASTVRVNGRPAMLWHGTATFRGLRFTTAGSYELEAGVSPTLTLSQSFVISPGAAAKMKIASFAAYSNIGPQMLCVIEMLDKFGNIATRDHSVITDLVFRGITVGAGIINGLPPLVANGIADVRLAGGFGRGLVSVRLGDSNPRIRPIWTPSWVTYH